MCKYSCFINNLLIIHTQKKIVGLQRKGMGEARCSKREINDRYANVRQIVHIGGQREI